MSRITLKEWTLSNNDLEVILSLYDIEIKVNIPDYKLKCIPKSQEELVSEVTTYVIQQLLIEKNNE